MRTPILFALVGLFLVACDPIPPEPPVAPEPDQPVLVDGQNADIPRSVLRLVAAEHLELSDMDNLVSIVGDERGRTRILNELESQREELDSIERAIRRADSDAIDDIVRRVNRLHSRTEVLHESLIIAAR